MDLVGLGLNATDTLISIPALPSPGSKAVVNSLDVMPGGQVATAVVACQYWGLRARYVGKLGDDSAAQIHRRAFDAAGVETHIFTTPNCTSAQSYIMVDAEGERSVLWHRDPRLRIAPEEINRDWIVNARTLLVDGCDTAAAIRAAQWAREAGVPVIADLDDAYPDSEQLLRSIDYLIVSRELPRRLSGNTDLRQSLKWLKHEFGCRLTAATLGAEGVLGWDGQHFHYSAAFRVQVVDSTGAGDIFHAAFVYGLLQGWPLPKTLDFACAAAALNCTAAGARGNIASVSQIGELLNSGTRHAAARWF